jgi:hypothetical protein
VNIIIAPHFDDEIIGCFELIINPDFKCNIIYTHIEYDQRLHESKNLKDVLPNIEKQSVNRFLQPCSFLLDKNATFYFPDPIYETHPDHREIGSIGEKLLRNGSNVIFYSINMKAPYIHKTKNPQDKEFLLDHIYPSQNDLWKYEKIFILFEGRCKWLI